MLQSIITVNLPSEETDRRRGPIEYVRSIFGAKLDLRSGKEELSVGAFSLVEGLYRALAAAGITDAISFLVDKKVVYLDSSEVENDLDLMIEAAKSSGILDKKFKEMHLVMTHTESGIHTLIDIRIQNQVLFGEEEMTVQLSGRVSDLRVREGESAEDYSDRVRGYASDSNQIDQARMVLNGLSQRIGDALRGTLVGSQVSAAPARVQLVRPNPQVLGGFRKLDFGSQVTSPTYRPTPSKGRSGVYSDPFYYYYYDPYYDYMSYCLIDSMIHSSTWCDSHIHVVEADGSELFLGSDAASHVDDGWAGHGALCFEGEGLAVDSAIPDSSTGDMLDTSSSAWGSSDAGDSSGSSESSDSGSSCGSSCGTSCGSSCGGD